MGFEGRVRGHFSGKSRANNGARGTTTNARPDRISGITASPPTSTPPPAVSTPKPVESHHFEIPKLRHLARHALPHIIEATLIPLGLFYLSLWQIGTNGAIYVALAWAYLAVVRRLAMRQRVPGLLLLSTLGLTARTALALAAHSAFIYFLQPSLATAALGGLFLFSIPAGRPLCEKLAHDFVPIPEGTFKRPAFRRVFVQITALWALVNLINAAGAVILLISQPLATYLAAKTGLTAGVTLMGVVVSTWWFKRTLRRNQTMAAVSTVPTGDRPVADGRSA
jgi:hypothetical protein